MSRQIPPDPFAHWPPLIDSARVPRAVKWRDFALTLLMWAVLLLILFTELQVALQALEVMLGWSDGQVDLALTEFVRKLEPLLLLVVVLVIGLGVATISSRRRRDLALATRQPEPLSDDLLAERAGLSRNQLRLARSHRIATVRGIAGTAISIRPRD